MMVFKFLFCVHMIDFGQNLEITYRPLQMVVRATAHRSHTALHTVELPHDGQERISEVEL